MAKKIFQRFAVSKSTMAPLSSGHTHLSQFGHFFLIYFFSSDQSLVPLTPPRPLNVEI